ncbi:hypothetical protein HGRIS_008920 [Hohenbuehelia grisea]|uniref:Uncharacterized protein n=1 Tax=Hohenbuehelia grisea TaxID=104357 RepID=A0ABR3J0Y9_9AGAR
MSDSRYVPRTANGALSICVLDITASLSYLRPNHATERLGLLIAKNIIIITPEQRSTDISWDQITLITTTTLFDSPYRRQASCLGRPEQHIHRDHWDYML